MMKYLIFICSFIGIVHALVDVTVDQSVVDSGFHRILVTNITLYGNLTSCYLVVEEKFPKNLFVSKDEVDDFNRKHEIVTRLSVKIDPEALAAASTSFSSYVYLNKSQPVTTSTEFRTNFLYEIPVHVRYHDPKTGGGFREFKKPPAVLFARCPGGSSSVSSAIVKFPCEVNSAVMCDWNSLSFTQKNLLPPLIIPVGNTDHYQVVLSSTHVAAYVALFYVLYTLFSTRITT